MDKVEKWSQILNEYFAQATVEQLVKDAAEVGITLIKMKKMKLKKRKKKTRDRVLKMGLRCVNIAKGTKAV